jgi:hypothetical protein
MARKQITNKYPVDEGDDIEVTITAMGGMDGSKLGIRLGAMLGPSLISLFTAMDAQSAAAGAEAGKMLFERLTPATFESIAKEVLTGAQMKVQTPDGVEFQDVTMSLLNETFSGNVASLFRLVFDAIKLNFRNFSSGLGISSAAMTKLQSIAAKQMAKVS